jgi:hypothetical protein
VPLAIASTPEVTLVTVVRIGIAGRDERVAWEVSHTLTRLQIALSLAVLTITAEELRSAAVSWGTALALIA